MATYLSKGALLWFDKVVEIVDYYQGKEIMRNYFEKKVNVESQKVLYLAIKTLHSYVLDLSTYHQLVLKLDISNLIWYQSRLYDLFPLCYPI